MRTPLVTIAALLVSSMLVALGAGCVDATTIYTVDGSDVVTDGAVDASDGPRTTTPDGSDDGK
jgi:hypothetical protein